MVEISSNPYLTSDFAFLPCFSILIGLKLISLCSPTRYAHTSAMQTIATSLSIRSISRICVSSMLKPEDFIALKAVSISHLFLYVKIALSGRLKQMRICNSVTPSEFLDSAADKIDIFTLMNKGLIVEFFPSDLQIIEQPPGTYSLTGGWLDNPEVLPYTDIIPYVMVVEPSYPFLVAVQ